MTLVIVTAVLLVVLSVLFVLGAWSVWDVWKLPPVQTLHRVRVKIVGRER